MKKIFTLVFCVLAAFNANAQIEITKGGEILKDGNTAEFYAKEELFTPDFGVASCDPQEPTIKNTGSSLVKVDITVKQEKENTFMWCMGVDEKGNPGIGTCLPIAGLSETKRVNLPAGKEVNLDLHWLDIMFKEYKTDVATVTVSANGKSQTIKMKFIYSDPTGIESLNNDQMRVANKQFTYNFSSNADRVLNVYGVSGRMVKSATLAQNGSVSLNDLQHGVYIYEVQTNGKRTATHKFVVR